MKISKTILLILFYLLLTPAAYSSEIVTLTCKPTFSENYSSTSKTGSSVESLFLYKYDGYVTTEEEIVCLLSKSIQLAKTSRIRVGFQYQTLNKLTVYNINLQKSSIVEVLYSKLNTVAYSVQYTYPIDTRKLINVITGKEKLESLRFNLKFSLCISPTEVSELIAYLRTGQREIPQ